MTLQISHQYHNIVIYLDKYHEIVMLCNDGASVDPVFQEIRRRKYFGMVIAIILELDEVKT